MEKGLLEALRGFRVWTRYQATFPYTPLRAEAVSILLLWGLGIQGLGEEALKVFGSTVWTRPGLQKELRTAREGNNEARPPSAEMLLYPPWESFFKMLFI